MCTFNNKDRIDRAGDAVKNVSQTEIEMSDSSPKTPWHLRFVPEIILRKSGLAYFGAISVIFVAAARSLYLPKKNDAR